MNLKPEELVKALRYCSNDYPCKTCPVELQKDESTCIGVLFKHCIDQIERDQKEIADLREKQQWIPVTERIPERDIQVIGWYKDNPFSQYRLGVVAWNGNGWIFVYAHRYVTDVTHWMPLPQPLKEE